MPRKLMKRPSGWTWNPSVVTPILSLDNTTVYINFASEVVSLAAFNLTNGEGLWNISNLEDDPTILRSDLDVPPDAALGGLLLFGNNALVAGLYDRYEVNPATTGSAPKVSTFNSGLLRINTVTGTVDVKDSWIYDNSRCFGNYQGGIQVIPVLGLANVYASDQFWGRLA